jgi:hypothetical protein
MFFKNHTHNIRYLAATATYGFTRKIVQMWNAKKEEYDFKESKRIEVPILNTHKLMYATGSGIASMYVWPYYVFRDISVLEIYMRNEDPKNHGYDLPKHEFEYIFN